MENVEKMAGFRAGLVGVRREKELFTAGGSFPLGCGLAGGGDADCSRILLASKLDCSWQHTQEAHNYSELFISRTKQTHPTLVQRFLGHLTGLILDQLPLVLLLLQLQLQLPNLHLTDSDMEAESIIWQ